MTSTVAEPKPCPHKTHRPILDGLNEPWASNWGDDIIPGEDKLVPPMPGSGMSLFKFGIICADCGVRLK